jgi:hypothetical protein
MQLKQVVSLLLLVVAIGALGQYTKHAAANPLSTPTISQATALLGESIVVTARWGPDEAGPASLSATQTVGVFTGATFTINEAFIDPTSINTTELVFTDDADIIVDVETRVEATFRCVVAGTTRFVLRHNGVDSSQSATLSCTSPQNVAVTASPNVLFCGGTTQITASLRDDDGKAISGKTFHFWTTVGALVQTSGTTADLTLVPGMTPATVFAKVDGFEGNVLIQNYCDVEIASVAVTAYPNVIECGGFSTLTATARDFAGHVIHGVGYHFNVTSGDGYLAPPPTAAHIENIALFTMKPGMQEAVITVTVGAKTGTVRVQQFCLGVTTDQTTAVGGITLNASSIDLVCGESAFVGARVRDSKNQVVPDSTKVNFLPLGLINPESASPVNGTLNVKFTAPDVNGAVRVTAAAGDSFGSITFNVRCAAPAQPPATRSSTGSSSGGGGATTTRAPACIPIGDGVCITPPNTGEAGLAAKP